MSTKEIKIFDNFLSEEEHKKIYTKMLNPVHNKDGSVERIPWEYCNRKVSTFFHINGGVVSSDKPTVLPYNYGDNDTVGELRYDTGLNDHMFVHMFYTYDGRLSPYLSLVNPIMAKIKALAVHRIKANMELYAGDVPHKSGFHVDWSSPTTKKGCEHMSVGIYYLNTNNGYTEFKDGSKVESVANRFVCFDGTTLHRGVAQTDTKERIVINFNFFGDRIDDINN